MKTTSSLELLEPRIAPAGLVKVIVVGDTLKLLGDAEANSLTVNSLENGTVDLLPASGTQLLFDGTTSAGAINVPIASPKLSVNFGAGDDTINVSGAYRSLTANTGAGNDSVAFQSLTVSRATTIQAGAGNDAVDFQNGFTHRVFGNARFVMGDGDNSLTVASSTSSFLGSWTYLGGKGSDGITLAGTLQFARDFIAALGRGFGGMTIAVSSLSIGGNLAVTAQNGPSDALVCSIQTFYDIKVMKGVSFLGGAGFVTVFSDALSSQLDIGGPVTVRSQGSGSSLSLQFSSLDIDGSVSVIGKRAASFSAPIFGSTFIDGNVHVRSADESAIANVGGTGEISGNVVVAGKGGALLLNNTRVAGNVSASFARAEQSITFSLTNTSIGGAVSFTGGLGADMITVKDSRFASAVRITTGAGNDTVNIEASGPGSVFTIFGSKAVIDLGNGDDALKIGDGSSSQHIIAFEPLRLNGGAGNDSIDIAGNGNVLFAPVTVTGFEVGSTM